MSVISCCACSALKQLAMFQMLEPINRLGSVVEVSFGGLSCLRLARSHFSSSDWGVLAGPHLNCSAAFRPWGSCRAARCLNARGSLRLTTGQTRPLPLLLRQCPLLLPLA